MSAGTGRLHGRVALVAGAARGQGRSHCVRLAEEGADLIAFDVCAPVAGVPYPAATPEDMAETVRQVEALDRRIVHARLDVRDGAGIVELVDRGVAEFGRLDVVSAQAGISHLPVATHQLADELWQTMLDVSLTGTWNTVKAAIPHLIAGGRGGAIVITTSAASLRGYPNIGHYVAAKHGLVGLMRTLSTELGPHSIRVTCVAPTNVATDMLLNQESYDLFRPDKAPGATRAEFEEAGRAMHSLPIAYVEPVDISNALLFLVSDEARYITGITLPVDAGSTQH